MIFDEDIIEKGGHVFKVFLVPDSDMEPPWENSDGHGPVTDWTSRDKRPGEWELNRDRGSKRFYDAAEANRLAKRDGWGLREEEKYKLQTRLCVKQPHRDPLKPLTAGEIRAEAVRRDFEFLRSWCNDEWRYLGVCVMHAGPAGDEDVADHAEYLKLDYVEAKALWGIENNAYDYIEEVAHGHIDEFLSEIAKAEAADAKEALEAAYWAQRGVMTQ